MSQHDLVSAQIFNVCITYLCITYLCSYSMYASYNLWCHFQHCPWEIGSEWEQKG